MYTVAVVLALALLSFAAQAYRLQQRRNLGVTQLWDQQVAGGGSCGPCKNAPLCSGEYADKGCDGTGRISGGVGAVIPWFPIKVYRPCPSFLAAGYQYKREGQTMDQVLFSEPSDKMKEAWRKRQLEQPTSVTTNDEPMRTDSGSSSLSPETLKRLDELMAKKKDQDQQ